jgi:hypothetical protein
MKKILMIAFGLMAWSSTFAADFTVDGINYTKTSSNEVSIAPLDEFGKKNYEGDFVIPDEVTYEGVTYKVTGFEEFALRGSGITSIKIGANITTIRELGFRGCKSLTKVEMTDNTTVIGERAFYECSALTTIKMSKNLTTIERSAFYDCTALESLEIPDNMTKIDEYIASGCSALKTLTIGSKVTFIGTRAFKGTALETISLPASVATMDIEAFFNCSNLKSIYVYGVPTCNTKEVSSTGQIIYPFSEEAFTAATLYVPAGKKADFQGMECWKNFTKIEEFDPTAIGTIKRNQAVEDSSYFDLQGRKQSGKPAMKGIYIKDGRKVLVK